MALPWELIPEDILDPLYLSWTNFDLYMQENKLEDVEITKAFQLIEERINLMIKTNSLGKYKI